jgi:hypothetical protein
MDYCGHVDSKTWPRLSIFRHSNFLTSEGNIMASSTNRSLKVKFERSRVQAREFVRQEMTKSCYIVPKAIVPDYDYEMIRLVPEGLTSRGKGMSNVFRQHF